ncbi:hypothetical protein GXN76_07850 [Kroppenstedtia pulmonis]|uniref:Uncharacterized protein n=1 Tax=Kroppenstedtia pulmonis TaxID=1380685 RepID=A0A7D3Y0F6_9BACL|nr:DUF6220 domain-containing protein [Kroppenstedtia pulmonis]QKG84400.1 hypothetical protein GXN76_07850 [Kroppenstedtia pulmonis]
MKQKEDSQVDLKVQPSTKGTEELTRGVRIFRIAFACLATIFAVCIIVQIFIAGLAVFVSPVNWMRHRMFAHLFNALPLIMLILSFVGRLPRKISWKSFGLFVLMYTMYITANITVILPFAAAVHPLIAMLLFWVSISIVMKAWSLAIKRIR